MKNEDERTFGRIAYRLGEINYSLDSSEEHKDLGKYRSGRMRSKDSMP